jgi:tetratricopeptide (TPR) repeat protein
MLAAFVAVGLLASSAWAADEAAVLRQRAEQLAAEDRCDEALRRARRARELDAGDARAALVEGRCLLRQGMYLDAVDPLSKARELDPSLPGVSTDLAQCHYHLDALADARTELDRAEAQDPDDARMHLYRGLVLLRESREAEAAAAFDRAGALDPGLAEVAGLYSGRSWAVIREREKAAAAFERARAAQPDSEWARAAEREIEALDAPYHRNRWLRLRGGVEYDDNVALRVPGSANALNTRFFGDFNFSERNDIRGVWEGEVGAEFLRDPDQSLGGMVGYDGNAHFKDFHLLDLQYPWISFWYDRRINEDTWFRLQPFGGYSWLETDPYVAHGGAVASVSHTLSAALEAQFFTRVNVNEFLFRIPPDPILSHPIVAAASPGFAEDARRRRNRDGVQVDVGTEWTWFFERSSTTFRIGGAYERYEAEGRDWGLHGGRGALAIRQPLPFDFWLALDGRFIYQDFDHRSSYLFAGEYVNGLGSKRRDRIWIGEAELGYPLTDWMTLSAGYEYTDNDSNTEVFDYDRHIVGGYLTFLWID